MTRTRARRTHRSGLQLTLDREGQYLTELAARSADASRFTPLEDEENQTAYRAPFCRDKDRIAFCRSFRRLSHKTQVYMSTLTDEDRRTRLTHTLEVAQLAKSIARLLSVNEDLVEAIAFGHDIGHAPFGHAGERQLDAYLSGNERLPRRLEARVRIPSGYYEELGDEARNFRHNFQGVRLATFLEKYDPDALDRGLNLTLQVLEGIVKHTSLAPVRHPRTLVEDRSEICRYPAMHQDADLFKKLRLDIDAPTTVEGQVVVAADEIAQLCHDINDALNRGSLPFEELSRRRVAGSILDKGFVGRMKRAGRWQSRVTNAQTVAALSQDCVAAVTTALRSALNSARGGGRVGTDQAPGPIRDWLGRRGRGDLSIHSACFKALADLKYERVVNDYEVNRMDNKGSYLIRQLFDAYLMDPRQLPNEALDDYVATKCLDYRRLQRDGVKAWLRRKEEQHALRRLEPDEERLLCRFLAGDRERGAFRTLSLLDKLIPYMAFDGDYRRAIADHIALMNDASVEQEAAELYSELPRSQ